MPRLDQRVVAALVFRRAALLQPRAEYAVTDVRLVRADNADAVIHERERSRRGEKLRPGDGAQRLRGRFGAAKL